MPARATRRRSRETQRGRASPARRARGEDLLLLDVREPARVRSARGSRARGSLPLGQLEARARRARRVARAAASWSTATTAARSAQACALLREHGFRDVENLAGGIDAWSLTVDPACRGY